MGSNNHPIYVCEISYQLNDRYINVGPPIRSENAFYMGFNACGTKSPFG